MAFPRLRWLPLMLVLLPGVASAQGRVDLAVSSALSPVGAGARATAVGSAFIAVADDATAASWNPGGLIQLERPEVSAVALGTYQHDEVGTLTDTDGVGRVIDIGTGEASSLQLNYLSAALPFSWRGRNLVVSLNYQQKLAFERAFDFDTVETGDDLVRTGTQSLEQEGAVYAFSPALAVDLTPRLSVGAALNYWFDGLGRAKAWESRLRQANDLRIGDLTATTSARQVTEFRNVRGVNGTLGFLWNVAGGWNVGGVVNLPFRTRLTSEVTLDAVEVRSDRPEPTERKVSVAEQIQLEFPLSFGFGVSYRPSDRLVVSLDVTHVRWDDFRIIDSVGNEFLITGDPTGDNILIDLGGASDSARVDPVTTVRAGAEYLFVLRRLILATRLGAFYDPEPSRGAPETFWGASLGCGVTWPDISVDFAYELRFGLDVEGTGLLRNVIEVPTGSYDSFRHSFYLSAVYYF